MATIDDFDQLDIRVGVIIAADTFPQARKPAYKLRIDFGDELGIKRSSAQITENYLPADLVGRQILAVVNLPARQIGPFVSEVLTLGVPDESGHIILVAPEKRAAIAARLS